MVGWTLDSSTEKILRSPDIYTRLSIYYLTSLRTTGGIALYEHAKRYATNPSGLTSREDWEWWYDVLTGLPMSHEKPEYKYFKRDTLKPAVEEVNTTDINIELIELKNGRRISQLQFKISKAKQGVLELPPVPVIDTKTVNRIRELGIHSREAEDIFAGNDPGMVRKTLDWLDVRRGTKELPNVGSPAALFRAALRGRYALTDGAIPAKKRVTAPILLPETEVKSDAAITAALDQFDAFPEPKKLNLLSAFALENPSLAVKIRADPTAPLVRKVLGPWLARQSAAIR